MNLSGYEVIHYGKVRHINIFMASITYRDFHMHSAWEIGVLEKGKACIQTKNREYYLEPGNLIAFSPDQVHAIKAVGEPTLFFFVQFSNNFCAEYAPLISKTELQNNSMDPYFSPERRIDIIRTLHEMGYAYFYETKNYDIKCISSLGQLIYWLFQNMPSREINSAEYSIQKKKTRRLNRIISYMEEHYFEPLRLSDLAKEEEISTTHLSHFFHDNMNMTFQNYLNSIRLDRALQLMNDSSLSVTDICIECGISDSRFLNKMLENRYGYTFKEYTERMKWNNQMRQSEHYTPTISEDCYFLTDENAKNNMLEFCVNGEDLAR